MTITIPLNRQKRLLTTCSFNEQVLMKYEPRTSVTHFRNSHFIRKMKGLRIPEKLVFKKFYVHEIAAVNLSKVYFLKNAKKTCKPNNHVLNHD